MVSEMESANKNSASHPVTNAAYMSNNNVAPQPLPVHTVGVEFVRQYYTMLNKAPHLLFRFYSDDSTFFHGCLDKPGEVQQYVCGQKQIGGKIMSLNFKNCHTKIRQVDSMETIGNGVVIQVIGELSNNGQPLRHFLQTFVLTPHGSPNKYYVRNDIFRYQDDQTYPEENEDQLREEKIEVESKIEMATSVEPPQIPPSIEKEMTYQPSNGTLGNAGEAIASLEEVVPPEPKLPPPVDNTLAEAKDLSSELMSEVNNKKMEIEEMDNASSLDTSGSSSNLANEPKTYANMVSKSYANSVQGSSGIGGNKASISNEFPPVAAVNYPLDPVSPSSASSAPAPTNKNMVMPPQREPRFPKKGGGFNRRNESRESGKNDSDSGEGDNHYSGIKKYPDENQLFIGNLLPEFGEEDLLKIFQKFGKIVEVRINRASHKMGSGKSGRNYGFITFDDPKVVDSVIAQKPIFHDNHRYNVEKKQGKSFGGRSNPAASSNPPRNSVGSSSGSSGGGSNAGSRSSHAPASSSGGSQGNPSGQRPRPGANFAPPNNPSSSRNSSGGSNFAGGRSAFMQQQQNR